MFVTTNVTTYLLIVTTYVTTFSQLFAGACKIKKKSTQAEKNRYRDLVKAKTKEFIVSKFGVIVYAKDLYKLRPGKRLRDESINFYLKLLVEKTRSSWNDIHLMSTFFFHQYSKNGNVCYKRIERWTRRVKRGVARAKLIIFPINIGNDHWVLMVVSTIVFEHKKEVHHYFKFFDSLGRSGDVYTRAGKKYLQQEYRKKPKRNKRPGFRVFYHEEDVKCPLQTNGKDCGAHLCANAYCVCHGIGVDTFTSKDIDFFRQHIALSIGAGSLQPLVTYPKVPDITSV